MDKRKWIKEKNNREVENGRKWVAECEVARAIQKKRAPEIFPSVRSRADAALRRF